ISAFVISVLKSAAAIVFTLPIVYIYFGYLSIAGIFVNAVLSPFITMVLVLGVLICVLQFLPVLPYVLGGANDVFALVIIKVAKFVSKFKYSQIPVDFDFVAISLAICLLFIAVAIFVYYFYKTDKNRLIKITSLLCVNVFLISILIYCVLPNNNVKLNIQNSGGAVNVSVFDGDKSIVIDYGGKYCDRKTKYLMNKNNSQKIDCLILPDADDNSFSSGVMISSGIKTDKVLLNTRVLDSETYNIKPQKQNIENIKEINYNSIKIYLITVSRYTALYVSNGQKTVLIIDKFFNCEKLPSEFSSCDLLVFNQGVPKGIERINSQKAIVFSYEEKEENKCAKIFNSYSLRKGNKEVYLSDNLKIKQV
ncbi:MAG: ComEC/Rec2 family competence protein, partial [Clostridia bacterium]|nr:ComEC/Rec2 family competence protein [Clostridia bacterium]